MGEGAHGGDGAVGPEGRAQAVEGGDGEQLGGVAGGELVLEPVLLLEHPGRPIGEAVDGAAGDVGREAALGLELGGLVVGQVEGGRGVGLGEEAQGGGLAGAGEGEDAQRAARVGLARREEGMLLGAGLQGGLRRHRAAGPG